jgi:outer membrane immunogenic protein
LKRKKLSWLHYIKESPLRKKLALQVLLFTCALLVSAQSTRAQSDEWGGFYVGGNVGASSNKSDAEATLSINQVTNLFVTGSGIVVIPATSRDFAASRRETKWSGGGQAGYQWQSGGFVFGFEGDVNPFHRTVSVTQSFQLPPTLLTPNTSAEARRDIRLSREFSLRARAGGAFGRTLVYGTFGYALAHAQVSSIDTFLNPGGATLTSQPASLGPSGPVVTTAEEEKNMGGWTGGVGIERKLGTHVGIGLEYRHTDYRSETFTLGNQTTVNTGPEARGTNGVAGLSGGVSTAPTRVSLKSDSVGVRVNFHF